MSKKNKKLEVKGDSIIALQAISSANIEISTSARAPNTKPTNTKKKKKRKKNNPA